MLPQGNKKLKSSTRSDLASHLSWPNPSGNEANKMSVLESRVTRFFFCLVLKANRWRKRGLSMMPIKFSFHWQGATPYTVLVSIYAEDGTVAVSHGGVEIGQGINTKVCVHAWERKREIDTMPYSLWIQVAQVTAKMLGIPLEMIKVKPSMTLTNPNGQTTGGSITIELNCFVSLLYRNWICTVYVLV